MRALAAVQVRHDSIVRTLVLREFIKKLLNELRFNVKKTLKPISLIKKTKRQKQNKSTDLSTMQQQVCSSNVKHFREMNIVEVQKK